MTSFVLAALVIVSLASRRRAEAEEPKHKLRIATVAPDGTVWANVFHKFTRDLAKATDGAIEARFYFGGVAGTEDEVFKLLEAGKLEGAISGGPLCRTVMPSMRVLDIAGLFQNQEEATHVLTELRPDLDREARKAGYELLTNGNLGPFIMFSRQPITSMEELEKTPLWAWDLNDVLLKEAADLKMRLVPAPLNAAQKAFDEKRADGFVTTPVAALAFQWYVGTKYITDLRTGYLMGCFVMREGALDVLSPEQQAAVRKGATIVGAKIDADNRRVDQKLLGGTYERLGLKFTPVSQKFRAEFFEAARVARQRLADSQLVSRDLLDKVTRLLADYRAEHR